MERKCIRIWVEMGTKYFKYSDGSEFKQVNRYSNGMLSSWLERIK